MALPQKEERIRRKKVMLSAGISVPNTDDSWGPWWEELWKKAITHIKTNDYYGVPSAWNFVRRTFDNITGNTTYEAEPLPIGGTILATDESVGALIERTLNNWLHQGDPVRDIVMLSMPNPSKPVTMGKAVAKTVPQLVKSVPKLLTKEGAKKAGARTVKTLVKEAPKATGAYIVGKGVDKASEAITGKSWSENAADKMSSMAGFNIEPVFGEATNPGYIGGYTYGNFVTNNYSNLGRYTLDNLYPAGYSLKLLPSAFKGYIEALYKKPPTFYTHRPKWYHDLPKSEFREARFENGANWARIPDSEIPRKYFRIKKDGVVEPTYLKESGMTLIPDFNYKGQKKIDNDFITPGFVGGEHSDFIYLGSDSFGNQAILFRDYLKLNPQWKLSDWIKDTFKLKEGTPFYNFIDKLGGYNLSWMLGYKPFTIEAGIGFPKGIKKGQQIDLETLKNVKTF